MDCIDFQKGFATVYDQEPDEALLSHIQDELQVGGVVLQFIFF